jgi:hypothetical protein
MKTGFAGADHMSEYSSNLGESTAERATSVFLTPLEVGIRALIILAAIAPTSVDLQRLLILDYFLVHSGDAEGPESLHPATPHRSGELLVKRDLLRRGLLLMQSRDLIQSHARPDGIEYSANDLTSRFLEYLRTDYAEQLHSRAVWLASRFGAQSTESLTQYVNSHLGEWGGEFLTEATVRDVRVDAS